MMETITYKLPSHWASYLFNGDPTSFSLYDDGDEELDLIDRIISDIDCGSPVDCSEESEFLEYHDVHQYGVKASDCLTYTFLRPA